MCNAELLRVVVLGRILCSSLWGQRTLGLAALLGISKMSTPGVNVVSVDDEFTSFLSDL